MLDLRTAHFPTEQLPHMEDLLKLHAPTKMNVVTSLFFITQASSIPSPKSSITCTSEIITLNVPVDHLIYIQSKII